MSMFPNNFLWGAASAAPQIEGGWDCDGRTPSIWDVAPAQKIKNGENCRIACDHYHRMREDVALMREIGLKSYRFSISWSRVIPAEGKINPKGLQFYSDLVDELRRSGIEPIVTIYHWDLPVWVQKKGGWMSESIIPLFRDYTKVVVEALSDRVRWWIPMNEPQCFVMSGHMTGTHAPFKKNVLALSRLTRICMRAHAEAVSAVRQYAKQPVKVGIAMAAGAFIPKDESREAVEEARRKTFYEGIGTMGNRWWGDPMLLGRPVTAYGIYRTRLKDMPKVRCKLDFLGVNVYQPFQEGSWGNKPAAGDPDRLTSMGWRIDGRCLYWTIRFMHERYGLPVMVTENGMADTDTVAADGKVHDAKRTRFIREYLAGLQRAVQEQIPVLGYQYWSILDNFEWAEGYGPRFGMVYVDYNTQKRIRKDSSFAYQKIIAGNGACLEGDSKV